ncbi:Beta-lactamase-like protein 2, partial [Kickxella alabastrina]
MSKMSIERVACDIIRVLGLNPGPMTLQGTNTYILGTGARRILVDTGDGQHPAYHGLLATALGPNSRISQILLTHWHHDHTGGLATLPESLLTLDHTVHKRQHPDIAALRGSKNITDGELFATEHRQWRAVLTPGHTPDHVAFFDAENAALITGDLVLGQGTTIVGDLAPYMRSLQRVIDLEPRILLPGHGPVVTANAVKHIEEYVSHRRMREKQILEVLADTSNGDGSGWWTVEEITAVVYPLVKDPRVFRAASNNVKLHLYKLKDDGSITCEDSAGGVV